MSDDIYLGDKIITDDDTYIDDAQTARLHKDGNDLILQVLIGGVWVDEQKWGS